MERLRALRSDVNLDLFLELPVFHEVVYGGRGLLLGQSQDQKVKSGQSSLGAEQLEGPCPSKQSHSEVGFSETEQLGGRVLRSRATPLGHKAGKVPQSREL